MSSNVSDVAETDEDILTLDIPDDALERTADAAPFITLVLGTWYFALSIGTIAPGLNSGTRAPHICTLQLMSAFGGKADISKALQNGRY